MSFDDDRDMCSKIAKGMITSLKMNDQELLGQHRFDTGAVRSSDVDHLAYHLISPIGLRRLAERYHKGDVNYPPYNAYLGIPATNLINHLVAHLEKYRAGDRADDHLAAIAWGAFTLMHFEETRPDMMDIETYPLRTLNADGSKYESK